MKLSRNVTKKGFILIVVFTVALIGLVVCITVKDSQQSFHPGDSFAIKRHLSFVLSVGGAAIPITPAQQNQILSEFQVAPLPSGVTFEWRSIGLGASPTVSGIEIEGTVTLSPTVGLGKKEIRAYLVGLTNVRNSLSGNLSFPYEPNATADTGVWLINSFEVNSRGK